MPEGTVAPVGIVVKVVKVVTVVTAVRVVTVVTLVTLGTSVFALALLTDFSSTNQHGFGCLSLELFSSLFYFQDNLIYKGHFNFEMSFIISLNILTSF